jgi:2-phospho-L-lactate guanylyltransferase
VPDVGIVPIKSFRDGNRRLAPVLDDGRRSRLGQALASHVARTVEDAGLIPLIVTADPEVAEWATLTGFPSHPDPDEGLDAAAAAGVEWAIRAGSRWIVIHGDLPLLTPNDLRALISTGESGANPISPSSDGGTSAIGGKGPVDFAFGPASFHRHLVRLPDPTVVVRSGLALDIDSPDDLLRARGFAGEWLREAIA